MPHNDPIGPLRPVSTAKIPEHLDYPAFMRKKLVEYGLQGIQIPGISPKDAPREPDMSSRRFREGAGPLPTIRQGVPPMRQVAGSNIRELNGKPAAGKNRIDWKAVEGRLGETSEKVAPFVSNLVNAFRKPPMPKKDTSNPYVTLKTLNLQNQRNEVMRGTAGANRSADRNVDGNTAEAIKQFNRGQEFDRLSRINETETNANTAIANRQAELDMAITAGNNQQVDDYNDMLLQRNIAQQREQSANWANAGDKLMTIKNEKEKARVEKEKAETLASLFRRSGVLDRQYDLWEKDGLDPLGRNQKAYGGTLGGGDPKVPPAPAVPVAPAVYQSEEEILKANQQAQSFGKRHNMVGANQMYVARKVGDPVVKFTNPSGITPKPFRPSRIMPAVPDYVDKLEMNEDNGWPYYKEGDEIFYVDKKHWYNDKNLSNVDTRKGSTFNNTVATIRRFGGPLRRVY